MHPHHMRQQQQQQHSVQPGASYPVLQPTHLARGSSAAPVPAARMYSSSSNNSAVTGQYVTSNDALRRGRGHFEGAGNTGDDYATSSWDSVRSVAPRRGTGDRDYAQVCCKCLGVGCLKNRGKNCLATVTARRYRQSAISDPTGVATASGSCVSVS